MWLYYFLIIYILLLGLLFGTDNNSIKRNKTTYFIFTFGLFTFISAFRAESIGNDTRVYLRIFENILVVKDLTVFTPRFEIGYIYFNKLISLISSQPQVIIITTSIFIIYGFARFIKKHSQIPWLSVYLFFTLGYYGMSMNTIRLNMAIVLILFAYDFLLKEKLVKFILIILFATLFHRTALVFLLAWFIRKLKFNYRIILSAISGSLLLYITFPFVLQKLLSIFPNYQYYIGSEYLNGEIRLASIMNLLVGICIIIFGIFTNYHKKTEYNDLPRSNSVNIEVKSINDGQLMLIFLIIGTSITFISLNFNLLDRVGDYFLVFSLVYLPNAINKLKNNKLLNLVTLIVVVLFFSYSTVVLIFRPEWNNIYPYRFFWQ